MNKMRKGISLVALIITIIVLIVLTAAVVLNGINTPQNAQLAVFFNNISTVQEAVTLKMMNNMSKYVTDENKIIEVYKWAGVVQGFIPNDVEPDFANSIVKINGVIPVLQVSDDIAKNLTMGVDEIRKYFVDENGVVYYYNNGEGFLAEDGIRYYNRTIIADSSEPVVIPPYVGPVVIPEEAISEVWQDNKLNETSPVVVQGPVIAPVPKDYTPSTDAENQEIVVYEGTEPLDKSDRDGNGIIDDNENRNQLVWIPVDDINDFVCCAYCYNDATYNSEFNLNTDSDCNIGIENGEVKCFKHGSTQILSRSSTDLSSFKMYSDYYELGITPLYAYLKDTAESTPVRTLLEYDENNRLIMPMAENGDPKILCDDYGRVPVDQSLYDTNGYPRDGYVFKLVELVSSFR